MPPEIIAGRYRVEREVGRGGMGSVWLCRDERLGRPVAVKQVGGLPGESSMHLARALREARHSAALNHPNVVAIFDALEEGDRVWLVMEYVPSRTLDELARSGGPLPPAEVARIGADVADGLAAAHALGTVHRDVKPSNILVRDDDGRALIADFGIARTVGQEQLTRSGLVTGTPAYFAPELARGEEPSTASDVWALGISLYAAVEGRPAYVEQPNAIAMLNTIASQPPPAPGRAGALAPVLQQMLDPDPSTRGTMAEAARAMRALAGRAVPTTEPRSDPVPTPVRGVRPPDTVATRTDVPSPRDRRRRPLALLAVAAALLLVMVVGGGWWLSRGDDEGSGTAGSPAAGPDEPTPSRTPRGTGTPSAQSTPEHSPPSSTAGSPSPSPVGSDAGSPAQLVADYYELLPEDTDAAWQLLDPELQERIGRGTYDGFWATIDDVRVDDTDEVEEGVVQVTLTYTSDGRSEQETRQLAVARTGDELLISADEGAV